MKSICFVLFLLWPGILLAAPKIVAKKALSGWSAREEKYLKGISIKLDALKDDDARKLLLQYFQFLREPTDDKAKEFSERALRLREKTGAPLVGLGFYSTDQALCPTPRGDCSYGIGNLSDKHLGPLLKEGNLGAIRVALVRHLVSVPSQAELMSYYAGFRVPRLLERHSLEVLQVLHDIRGALAAYNPGKTCYQFKFFDVKLTPEKIKKALPAKDADELIEACAPAPTPSATPVKKG